MALSSATTTLIERAIVVGQRLVLDRRGTSTSSFRCASTRGAPGDTRGPPPTTER